MSYTKHPILLNRFELPMPNSTPGVPDAMEKHAHRIAMEADSEAVAAAKAIPASIRMDNEWSMSPEGDTSSQSAPSGPTREVNVILKDSYGDGYNGVTIKQKGGQGLVLNFTSGRKSNEVVQIECGKDLEFECSQDGDWHSEVSFQILDREYTECVDHQKGKNNPWVINVPCEEGLAQKEEEAPKDCKKPGNTGNLTANKECEQCTSGSKPPNSTFTESCKWQCDDGFFQRNDPTSFEYSCEVKKESDDCEEGNTLDVENNMCIACSSDTKPENASYTTNGTCDWKCNVDFFQRGENTCEPRKTMEDCKQPGNTGDVTEDNQCETCDDKPLNSTFTKFCEWKCDENYYRRENACEVLMKPEFCDPGMTVEDNICTNTCDKPEGSSYTTNGTCDFKCNVALPDRASYEDGTCNIVCNGGRFLREEEGVMRCEDIVSKCLAGNELDSENNMCTACPESPENSEYFDGCQWQCKEGFEMDADDEGNTFCKRSVEEAPEPPSHEGHDHREMQAGAGPCMKDPNSSECQKFMESMQRFGNDPNAPEGTQTFGSKEEAEAAANRNNFDSSMLPKEERNQGLADVTRQREREGKTMPKAEEGQPSSECVSKCNGDQACMASCMRGMNMGYKPGQTRDDLGRPDMYGVSEEDKKMRKMEGMSEDEKAMYKQSGGDPDAINDATIKGMTRGMDESMYNPDSQDNRGNKDMFDKMQAAERMGGPPETDIMGDFIDQVLNCPIIDNCQGLSSLECLTEVCDVPKSARGVPVNPMIKKMFAEVNLETLGNFRICLSNHKDKCMSECNTEDVCMTKCMSSIPENCKALLMSQKEEGPKGEPKHQHGGGMPPGMPSGMGGMPPGMDMDQMQGMMGGTPDMDMDQMRQIMRQGGNSEGGGMGGMPPNMRQGGMGGMPRGGMPSGMGGMFR